MRSLVKFTQRMIGNVGRGCKVLDVSVVIVLVVLFKHGVTLT